MLPGVPVPSKEEEAKIQQKNLLVNALGSDGQQIVVVGDTSTGKSTCINFLLGYPINFESRKIGTRRPCVICQVSDPNAEQVTYSVKFFKAKEPIDKDGLTEVEQVAKYVQAANDPESKPHYFDVLLEDKSLDPVRDQGVLFDMVPIFVTMRHKDFKYGLRLIDLPGLIRKEDGSPIKNGPMQIARTYIKPGNIVILVMGEGNAANGGFPMLAEQMAQCSQVLFVQNFGNAMLINRGAEDNKDALKTIYQDLAKKGDKSALALAQNLDFFVLDVGFPKTPEFTERGKWQEGKDQENWVALADQGCEVVQKAMYDHAERKAREMEKEHAAAFQVMGAQAGVGAILKKLVQFSFEGIDQKIYEYRKRIEEMTEEQSAKLEELTERCKSLDDPPEWRALLSKCALVVSDFLDTTIAIPETDTDGTLGDVVGCCIPVEGEWKLEDRWEEENSIDYGEFQKVWFDPNIDKAIYELLVECNNFEKDNTLACLRSWFRLLDEFISFLAFAPMPHVEMGKKIHITKRITQGASASTNKLEDMVELVASLDGAGNMSGIRGLILKFTLRLIRLAQRDLVNAMTIFRRDKYNAISNFLACMSDDDPNSKTMLCDKMEEVILDHMRNTFSQAILGEWLYDINGQIKVNSLSEQIRKPNSGITVIDAERRCMHWLMPFKGFYFNGQIPWTDLRPGPDFVETPKSPPALNPPDTPNENLMGEVCDNKSMNAANCINLKIIALCTADYTINVQTDASELDYSCEVMKLLKAMQGEVASFWLSNCFKMIQDLQRKSHIRDFVKKSLKRDLSKAGKVIEVQNMETWGTMFLSEAEGVIAALNFSGMDTPDNALNTKQELEAADADLRRYNKAALKLLPTEELTWPGMSKDQYFKVLAKSTGLPTATDKFPLTANFGLSGDAALRRLSEEFGFVVLQLSMKPVNGSELAMAKASRGKQIVESPQEIVTKLVCHRLQNIGQSAGIIWKYRFMYLWKRGITNSIQKFCERRTLPNVGDEDGKAWFTKTMEAYLESAVDDMRGALARKFDELTPFDWTTLNGRFPFGGNRPIRKDNWTFMQENRKWIAQKQEVEKAEKSIINSWNFPLRYNECWKDLMEPEMKYLLEKDPEMEEYITLDEDTNTACYATLDDSSCDSEITTAMTVPDDDKPGGDPLLCGGAFHEMALRVHKSMVANAIDYCKPRMKYMMSQVYMEENLRNALSNNSKLKYKDMYGAQVEKVKRERDMAEVRLSELKDTILILDGQKKSKVTEIDPGAAAASAAKKAKAEAAANKDLEDKLSTLNERSEQQSNDIGKLTTENDEFKKDLKKYVACEQLACWSLSIQNVELSKLTSPGEDAKIILQGFYFEAPGWDGRDIKKIPIPKAEDILPYQWLFSCNEKDYKEGMSLEWKVAELYDDPSCHGLAGLRLPVLFPVQQYLLAIEVKAIIPAKKKGIFAKQEDDQEKTLFTIALPLAYALRDKTTEFARLESVGAFGPMHRAPDCGGALRMEERMARGEEKTYKFSYEASMSHYGMDGPLAKGAKLEIIMLQNQEKKLVSKAKVGSSAGSSGAYAAPKGGFKAGDQVLYYSAGRNMRFPTKILKVFEDGSYEIQLKPGDRIKPELISEIKG